MEDSISGIMTMSTLHLTGETVEKIVYDECASITFCNTFGYGFVVRFIRGASYRGEGYDDLADCIEYADSRGCSYIRFDDDGPVYRNLPTYTADADYFAPPKTKSLKKGDTRNGV